MPSDKRQRQRENTRARQQAMAAAAQRQKRRTQIIVAVVAVVLVGAALAYAMKGGGSDNNSTATATTTTTAKPLKGNADVCPPAKGTAKRFTVFDHAPIMCIDPAKKYTAAIKTDAGTITVDLNAEAAPKTVNNFVFLARNHFFDGIIFHRVIPDFMDQTGDPQGNGTGGPGYQFEDEIPDGYVYTDGDVAMANSGPNTNGSQFFLVASDNGAQTLLSAVGGVPKYSPFGHVTAGLSVVKKINKDGSGSGEPNVEHHMISVTITEE
ncbi:MAG TPA: peptidylprolyl isomerase [Acidimicrobiales bacterium]|nr:peptidylprolyl isomerase [Acidimicrobiales bacterium]